MSTTSAPSNGPLLIPSGTKLLGEIITWACSGVSIQHLDLIEALRDADLDESVARELAPRYAFSRACKKLARERIIRQVSEDATSVVFQFTTERREDDRFTYELETLLTFEKATGRVTCPLAFPASTLAQIEGRGQDRVTLEALDGDKGRASWSEVGSPMTREFRPIPADQHLRFPSPPTTLKSTGPGLLQALDEASRIAPKHESGRPIHRLFLNGRTGLIAATDGQQLLIHTGFSVPFKEELLIPRLTAWGCRELTTNEEPRVSLVKDRLFIGVGGWTFVLTIEPKGRYPDVESVVPSPRAINTRLRLTQEDVALLCKEVPHWPGSKEYPAPIQVEVGQPVILRPGNTTDSSTPELRLVKAQVSGKSVQLVTDWRYLLQALKLGFTEFEFTRPDSVACCRDGPRTYVWMLLGTPSAAARTAVSVPTTPEEKPTMPDNNGRQPPSGNGPEAPDPLAEAEAIRNLLSEAQTRLTRLIGSLRYFRKHSRAVRAAVDSLRQLPPLTP